MMEVATKHLHKNARRKEQEIIGLKVAGFKRPEFAVFVFRVGAD